MERKLRILVVEDDEIDRRAFARLVERADLPYDYVVAGSCAAAKESLARERFDAAVVDYLLGDGTASDLFGELADTPFVVITGSGDEEFAVEAMKAGASDYLVKDPAGSYLKTLPVTVENAIRRQQAEKELEAYRKRLEELVQERTAELTQTNAQLVAEIDERARAEGALRRSEERFRLIFEESPIGIELYDSEGLLIETNKACLDIFGVSDSAEIRRSRLFDYPNLGTGTTEEALAAGQTVRYELAYDFGKVQERLLYETAKSGTLYLDVLITRLGAEEPGAPGGYLVGVQDITTHKHLEEQVLQAGKLETVGRLAGGVAHDFNNLLTSIIGYATFALNALAPSNPIREDIQEVLTASERASQLTRQLLAFSRHQPVAPSVIDLNALILDLDKMLRRLIGENIELAVLPAADLGAVRADPGQIEQVLVNLVVNARDAMPGGGRLIIETGNVTLDESYAREHIGVAPGDYVRVAVSDMGLGMTPEVKARVFEPFFTTKQVGQGSGLGLAIVYGIIKKHQGTIEVFSEPGKGTTFHIYLPRVHERAERLPMRDEVGYLPRGTETVLTVEDEPMVRGFTARALRELGYTVLEAANGEEALRVAQKHTAPLHLLLTDVVMPRMGGEELAGRLKAMFPSLKVVFMSGYTDRSVVRSRALAREAAFLQKPFTMTSLARLVREVLGTLA